MTLWCEVDSAVVYGVMNILDFRPYVEIVTNVRVLLLNAEWVLFPECILV